MTHKFVPRNNRNRPEPELPNKGSGSAGSPDAPRKESLRKRIKPRSDGPAAPPPGRASRPKPAPAGSIVPYVVVLLFVVSLGLAGVGIYGYLATQVVGYKPEVKVAGPTRLDWSFAESGKSETKPHWNSFESTSVKYEFYAPANYDSGRAYPLVVFLSPEPRVPSAGWLAWRKLCVDKGLLFAAPYALSETREPWERIRAVCDVLDDVKKQYRVDPDRTYICGTGLGANLACRVGFALPELFGGVLALDGADFPPDVVFRQVFGQQRVSERLSIVFGVPEGSPNKDRVEQLHAKYFEESGGPATAKFFPPYPDSGGAMPAPAVLEEMLRWLDGKADARRALGEKYPATRVVGDPPSREQAAEAVFAEGKKRLEDDQTSPVGIALVQAVTKRWADTPASKQAQNFLLAYVGKGKSPEDEVEEGKRAYRLALGKSVEKYLSGLDPAVLEKTWDLGEKSWFAKESPKELRQKALDCFNVLKQAAVRQKNRRDEQEFDKHIADLGRIEPKASAPKK